MSSINTALITPVDERRTAIGSVPAQQQPNWGDDALNDAITSLELSAPLVSESEIDELKRGLQHGSQSSRSWETLPPSHERSAAWWL